MSCDIRFIGAPTEEELLANGFHSQWMVRGEKKEGFKYVYVNRGGKRYGVWASFGEDGKLCCANYAFRTDIEPLIKDLWETFGAITVYSEVEDAMESTPGCPGVETAEGKLIYNFLVYVSNKKKGVSNLSKETLMGVIEYFDIIKKYGLEYTAVNIFRPSEDSTDKEYKRRWNEKPFTSKLFDAFS